MIFHKPSFGGPDMKILVSSAALAGLVAFGGIAPAQAHHSFAMFDATKRQTITGTIKELQWTNPHGVVWVYVPVAGNTDPQVWAVELTSPGNLRRAGWTKDSVKPGDKVEVVLNPLRNGETGGGFVSLKFSDSGKELRQGLTAPPNEKPSAD